MGERHADMDPRAAAPDKLALLEERLSVDKRRVTSGTVRVTTMTETHQETAEASLDRSVVDVERVPVGRVVEESPKVRTEGDTVIVPIVEERLVVVKQLFLKEELHIRHRVETETVRQPVDLRRQHAIVEHLAADGQDAVQVDSARRLST